MIPPHLAVQAICSALQMNDWPEEDAGVHTAYLFTKPHECETLIAGQVQCTACRSHCFSRAYAVWEVWAYNP